MPRAHKPREMYSVSLIRYTSEEAKQAVITGDWSRYRFLEEPVTVEMWFCQNAYDERAAAVLFSRLCREASTNHLASRVVLTHGREKVVVWAHPPQG
jgi:hypothetical protein